MSELRPATGLSFTPRCYMCMDSPDEMILTERHLMKRRETCPSATLSITNSTRTLTGANPGFRVKRPATYSGSHGTAKLNSCSQRFILEILSTLSRRVLCYFISRLGVGRGADDPTL
jgi:hypothetical protein